MEHSINFDKVKSHYDEGFWDIKKVSIAVKKNWITVEEFEEITGKPYES